MTNFTDGPAAGKNLNLSRSPIFLRVCVDAKGNVDALDLLEDTPKPDEKIHVYQKMHDEGTVHVDGRDKNGKRFGRWYRMATYCLCKMQPDEATGRSKEAWPKWCGEERDRQCRSGEMKVTPTDEPSLSDTGKTFP